MTALVKQRCTLAGEWGRLVPSLACGGFLLLVLGCAGRNVVAGEEKTKSQQLEEALPSWCRQTCDFMAACAVSPGERECETGCQKEMSRYALGTDECAQQGLHFVACVDSLTCDEFRTSAGNRCQATETEEARCPRPGAADDPPRGSDPGAGSAGSSSGGGSSTGGTASTAGGGAIGGDFGAGGAIGGTSGGPAVSCAISSGTGGSPYGSSSFTCEETRQHCSDGHDYGWICASGSQMLAGCSCFVDGQVTGGFAPGAADECPSLQLVNAGCGWGIAM